MEFAVIATPNDALGLRLDWERFAYAGKFVMTNTGKAVAIEDDQRNVLDDPSWPPDPREAATPGVVAAVSFNRDREQRDVTWLRYVTVRSDHRGQEVGPRLCAMTASWVLDQPDYARVRIAVNNPYALDALYKAGFGWTGETTGLRERVMERPPPTSLDPAVDAGNQYRDGLRSYLDTDLSEDERSFIDDRLERGPPATVDAPKGEDYTGAPATDR